MADAWTTYSATPINATALSAIASSLTTLITQFQAGSQATIGTLSVLSALLLDETNALRSLSDSAVAALRDTTEDFFQNNVGVALHTNLEWDPAWVYRRTTGAPNTVNDFVTDGELPWVGRGMQSWLLDLAASARDPSDPFRPYTDKDTSVGGFIVLNGVAAGQDIQELADLYRLFTDRKDFAELFSRFEFENADEQQQALFRMGPMAMSTFVRAAAGPIVMPGALDPVLERVTDFRPRRGNYPKWASVPLAAAVPALGDLFTVMREISDNLQVGLQRKEHLNRLIDLLNARAQILSDASERIDGVLATLVSLDNFFETASVIFLEPATGGFDNFVVRAANAAGVPNFGERGIVSGVVFVGTHDDPLNHLESLLELVGIQAATLASGTTTRVQNLSDTYDSLF